MYCLRRIFDILEAKELIEKAGLNFSTNLDYSVGLYDQDRLIATGSLAGKVIMCLATLEEYRGEGLITTIISDLISYAAQQDKFHLFLYTKPDNRRQMESLGFQLIGCGGEYAVLMERGFPGIELYKKNLQQERMPAIVAGAIVMNLNPLTKGHLYLIEQALECCDALYVFVVQEDRSRFPFKDRISLLRQAVGDHPKIKVLPSGEYMISSATFPSYFLKAQEHARAQIMLDVDVFVRHIAPVLGIAKRFAGHEPYCALTRASNDRMREMLPPAGIEFCEIERLGSEGSYISASRVRKLIDEKRWEELKRLVPEITCRYILDTVSND